jgi:hypothetical protein
MKTRIIIAVRILLILALVSLTGISLILHRENRALAALFYKQEFGTIPKDIAMAMSHDLDSGDTNRLIVWRAYLHHTLELDALQTSNGLDVDRLLTQYRTLEQPGRSNYFGDLVNSLIVRQQTKGLSRASLISYLGRPDELVTNQEGEVLRYRYSDLGRNAVASIRTSNSTVLTISVTVDP